MEKKLETTSLFRAYRLYKAYRVIGSIGFRSGELIRWVNNGDNSA